MSKKAANGKPAARMGRPQIEIDSSVFEGLCAIQCTLNEIAGVMNVSADTVERWCKRTYEMTFADTFRQKSASGRISLRRLQFKMAEKSPALAIWLGKQYLGQADKTEVKAEELDAIIERELERIAAAS